MAIVILHRAALASSPYHEWLKDSQEPLFLITSQEKLDAFSESLEMLPQHAYQSVHAVKQYDTNGEVELAVLDIAKTHTIRAIVAQAEFDVERAARLRAYLNIPGQDEHSARCFRNKVTMKAVLQRANVPVAPFSAVQSVHTLLDFAQQYGFPLVVKPQNGAGSYGVTLLRDQSELDHFIAQGFTPALDVVPNLMVEQFVPGRTYHIDGIVVQGKSYTIIPSCYHTESLDFQHNDGEATASYTLAKDNPLTERLQQFVQSVLDALSTPDTTTFHAEVFHTPDDQLVLCEIASRTGGARIGDGLEAALGCNLNELWARQECGLATQNLLRQIKDKEATRPITGWALISPKPGLVKQIPSECGLSEVVDYTVNISAGCTLQAPKAATESIASFVFVADDEQHACHIIDKGRAWFHQYSEIEGLAEHCVG